MLHLCLTKHNFSQEQKIPLGSSALWKYKHKQSFVELYYVTLAF